MIRIFPERASQLGKALGLDQDRVTVSPHPNLPRSEHFKKPYACIQSTTLCMCEVTKVAYAMSQSISLESTTICSFCIDT